MLTMSMSTRQQARWRRLIIAEICDCTRLPSDHAAVAALQAERNAIQAAAKEREEAKDQDREIIPLGPTAPTYFMAVLEALTGKFEIGSNLRKILTGFMNKVQPPADTEPPPDAVGYDQTSSR